MSDSSCVVAAGIGSFSEWLESFHFSKDDLAFLAAQGTIRIAVMGFDDRKPTEAELERMKALLARELEDGCVGLSTGLIYPPGCYTDTAELVELCKVAARYGGVYATHMRGESAEIIKSVEEAIRTAVEHSYVNT